MKKNAPKARKNLDLKNRCWRWFDDEGGGGGSGQWWRNDDEGGGGVQNLKIMLTEFVNGPLPDKPHITFIITVISLDTRAPKCPFMWTSVSYATDCRR